MRRIRFNIFFLLLEKSYASNRYAKFEETSTLRPQTEPEVHIREGGVNK